MVGQLAHRILIVDDSNLVRRAFSGALVAAGYVVRTAVDGLDAIGKLRAGLPDLIISDLGMPRMSGYEFLAVMRDRFPEVPAIAMSCEAASQRMPEGLAADAFLQKDELRPEDLLQLISDLIKSPPIRTTAPRLDLKPVQANWDGDGHYVIACAECLRSFKVRCYSVSARGPLTTACDHCRGFVCFLP
jgi:CheY-like chemotaxis protein